MSWNKNTVTKRLQIASEVTISEEVGAWVVVYKLPSSLGFTFRYMDKISDELMYRQIKIHRWAL